MRASILKLPDVIENEIREYTLTKSLRLRMLLDKYPLAEMDILFNGFTKEQVDRVYRYGCVSKILSWDHGYTMFGARPIIRELLKNDALSFSLFTHTCWPACMFNTYWEKNDKKIQPSKPEYINRIKMFYTFVLTFSLDTRNENFICFCENVVYDLIVGSLIMCKNQ